MKNYIKDMREIIGTKRLFVCGATMILVNDKNEILLQQRKDNKMWGFPGGIVEIGEDVKSAAMRETFEEVGITLEEAELFDVFSGEELLFTYPNGDEVYIVDILFISRKFSGEIKIQESECLDGKFFSLDDIPKEINPPTRPSLKAVVEHLRKSK